MFFVFVDLCLLLLTGGVSSTELAVGYIGCERELPAESLDSNISESAVRIHWARDDLGGNILSFLIPENRTTYLDVYNETKYVVNQVTYALLIRDITAEDADLYTRTALGSIDLDVDFTALELSTDDLNGILRITYDGKVVTSENNTLIITSEDTEPLLASTQEEIENAGNPDLEWIDAASGTSKSAIGAEVELPLEPGIYFVKSTLCNTEANSFNITITEEEGSPTNASNSSEITVSDEITSSAAITSASSTDTKISTSPNSLTQTSLSTSADQNTNNAKFVETSIEQSSSTMADTNLPYSYTISGSHFATGGQTTTSIIAETDSTNQGGSTSPGMNHADTSYSTTIQETDATTVFSTVRTSINRRSGTTTDEILSTTTLTENESEHMVVLAVPGIVVYIGGVIALTVVFCVKVARRNPNT